MLRNFTILCVACCLSFSAPAWAECDSHATQTDLNICSHERFKESDRKLNDVYQQKLGALANAETKLRLKIAQRAWVALRDASCAYEVGARKDSGSIWPLQMNSCLTRITDARIDVLNDYLRCTRAEDFCPL